jgi:molecular chaperone Hsp33
MTIEEKKQALKNRDRIMRIMTDNGHFRASLIRNTQTAQTAQENHKLSGIPASFLARTLSGASLIASFLKGEERAILELMGNGVISKIYGESSQHGESRGYLSFSENNPSYTVSTEEDILGIGLLRVTRILYDKAEPVTGVIELPKSDVGTDLAYYFNQSEQIPTAVLMDVVLDDSGKIIHSSGFMVQAMPGYAMIELKMIFDSILAHPHLSALFDGETELEVIMKKLIPVDFSVTSKLPVDFFCRCKKDNFIRALHTLEINEIKEMKEQGHNELVCQYCNKHYYVSEEEFSGIIEKVKAQKN